MNRKNLTAAVLAGLAGVAGIVGSAQAVNINPDGLGQVLVYPYYTVNGGNSTILSVVNTSEDAKAVKVRFLEGMNSQEVLDFNLYMSAFDVWTAAIYENADGIASLITLDTSCTVPLDVNETFKTFELADGGPVTAARVSEGHFEMIEMGTLVGDSAEAVTHNNGVPPGCQMLVDAWTSYADPDEQAELGYWENGDALIDIETPSGGLFGGAAVVDVNNGAMYSYDAIAINGFSESVYDSSGFRPVHTNPGDLFPNLSSNDVTTGYVFLDNGGNTSWNFGDDRSVDAVSYVFMHDAIMNEYTTDGDIGANTEWVISFPTKHFYVNEDLSGSDEPLVPFTRMWGASPQLDGEYGACETITLDTLWDREEDVAGEKGGENTPPGVSPPPPVVLPPGVATIALCYETSVIRFGDVDTMMATSEILGSSNFTNIDNVNVPDGTEDGTKTFAAGWARLNLVDYVFDENDNGVIDPDEEDLTREPLGNLSGLPVTGFSVSRFQNSFLGEGADVLANYGGIMKHKATRMLGSGG